MPPVLSAQELGRPARNCCRGEELTRVRDAWPPSAAGCRGWPSRRTTASRSRRFGRPARPIRRAPPAHPVPLLPRAGRVGLARAWLRRLLVPRRPGRSPRPSQRSRHDLAFVSRAPQPDIERWKARGWAGRCAGTRSPTTSKWTDGTRRTPSCATATRSSVRTSSTTAATRRWAARGATSTSPRSGTRRSGIAAGLPADRAVPEVERPRGVRQDDLTAQARAHAASSASSVAAARPSATAAEASAAPAPTLSQRPAA